MTCPYSCRRFSGVLFGGNGSLLFTDVNMAKAAPEGGLRGYNVTGSKGA
jgi:hypothetical protein